jgi:hypothetical protein
VALTKIVQVTIFEKPPFGQTKFRCGISVKVPTTEIEPNKLMQKMESSYSIETTNINLISFELLLPQGL